jgi:hypothetical protein
MRQRPPEQPGGEGIDGATCVPALVEAALKHAVRGWFVFPLNPGSKRPRAQLVGWEHQATTDTGRITRWWDRHPADNVAIACGPSGLVVVDLDVAKPGEPPPVEWRGCTGGLDVFRQLTLRHRGREVARSRQMSSPGELGATGRVLPTLCANTWTVATPSGGRHLYFRAPSADADDAGPSEPDSLGKRPASDAGRAAPDSRPREFAQDRFSRGYPRESHDGASTEPVPLRNTSGRLGWRIDTRAAGGYVVAAGSIIAGRRYTVIDTTAPAELPAWIVRLLTPPPPAPVDLDEGPRPGAYVDVAVAAEVQRVLSAGPGARNWALNKAAWNLGRLVSAGLICRVDVEAALQLAAEAAGYADGPRAATAVVRAALDARLGRRSGPDATRPGAVLPVEPNRGPADYRSADLRPGQTQ